MRTDLPQLPVQKLLIKQLNQTIQIGLIPSFKCACMCVCVCVCVGGGGVLWAWLSNGKEEKGEIEREELELENFILRGL